MKRLKIAWNKIVNNTIRMIRRIRRDHLIREYCKNNVLFLTFVGMNVLIATLLRFFCMHSIDNYLSWKAILADTIVVTFVGAFGYLLKPGSCQIHILL